jgi:hypothetical protein
LSLSAIFFILVGEFDEKIVKTGLAEIVNQLMKSKMAAELFSLVLKCQGKTTRGPLGK